MIDEADYLARLRDLHAAAWPAGVPRETTYPLGEIPLSDHLRHWGRETPQAPAIHFYGRTLSYGELDALSDRFANLLLAEGIGRGDRVAVFLPNCPQFHIAFFGILKIGAVHCPVSPLSKGHELGRQLADSGARALIAQDRLWPVAEEVREGSSLEVVWSVALSRMLPEDPGMSVPEAVAAAPVACPGSAGELLDALERAPAGAPQGADLDAPAALNYTSGSTGEPKGCVHTQRSMVFTAAANLSLAGPAAREAVSLSFFPEFWIAGENAALIYPVLHGRPLVLMTRWDPLGVMQAVERWRVTGLALMVDGAMEILDHPRFAEFDLSSLSRVRVVSFVRKLDRDARRRWREATGTVLAESAWGMTETHTANSFTSGMQDEDFDLRQQPVFVGLPVPGNEFCIRDFDDGAILPLDAEGEICIRTPALMKGYWGRPEETAETIREGWLHSGDIGVIDAAGYLHYLGRRKEMLKVRGMSVFPAEIEALLGGHDAVQGAGVIGRPDPRAGQVPVAFVQLRPEARGATGAEDLRVWLDARMAAYKIPEIRLVETLPMTATGKVRKAELADRLDPGA